MRRTRELRIISPSPWKEKGGKKTQRPRKVRQKQNIWNNCKLLLFTFFPNSQFAIHGWPSIWEKQFSRVCHHFSKEKEWRLIEQRLSIWALVWNGSVADWKDWYNLVLIQELLSKRNSPDINHRLSHLYGNKLHICFVDQTVKTECVI